MNQGEELLAFHIRAAKLCQPVREYQFHAIRKWRFDFAWPDIRLAVEIEGGIWTGGRHTRGKGFVGDCEKYNEASLMGWTVLRFPVDQIASGEALQFIEKALKQKEDAYGTRRTDQMHNRALAGMG
jgi:very-short-patch-repair endonuclease